MLEKLRNAIDTIDDQLIKLLNERMGYVRQVGELKRTTKASIYRPEREKSIIDRLCSTPGLVLNRAAVEAIFLEIFAVSRNYELPERVAYLGPVGSFTHQAAESRYGAMSDYLALPTITSVFEAVDTSRVRFGVVPIENNQEGTVQETIDLLGQFSTSIVSEIVLPIHFAFASRHDKLKEVRRIYSREIAFRQCKKFIREFFGDHIELVPVSSTSQAMEMALREESVGAIGSHIAARVHGLPILYDNIEDSADNHTRFLILSREYENPVTGSDKTSILARLPDKPGALADLLQVFYDKGINLCKVESRPAKEGSRFKYVFFIDFDGHYKDPKIEEALAPYRNMISWLGSYIKMC